MIIDPQMNTDVLVRVYAAKAFIWRIKNPQGRLCPLGCTANTDDLLARPRIKLDVLICYARCCA